MLSVAYNDVAAGIRATQSHHSINYVLVFWASLIRWLFTEWYFKPFIDLGRQKR